MKTWEEAANYCEETFGSHFDREESFFICPECGEPIYCVDWRDYAWWDTCPICECIWEDID